MPTRVLDDLDRIGAPGDQAAPLHVSIAVGRIMRTLGQLPEFNRAADAVKAIRIVTANIFAQAEWDPSLDREEILRALFRGIRSDVPILDRELQRQR